MVRLLRGNRVGDGRDRGAVADPDDRAVADRGSQPLAREPADHPPADLFGPDQGRREMDGAETEPLAQLVTGGRYLGGSIDDPDLDDALGARPLEEARDLRSRDAQQLGDARLCLAELVVEPASLDQLVEVWHGSPVAGSAHLHDTDVHPIGRVWGVPRPPSTERRRRSAWFTNRRSGPPRRIDRGGRGRGRERAPAGRG